MSLAPHDETARWPLAPTSPTASAQVVVVGAGLGGLAAAYELQQARVSCLVLQARPRIGGRTAETDDAFGHAHPRLLELLRSLGLEAQRRDADGKDVVQGLDVSQADGPLDVGMTTVHEPSARSQVCQLHDDDLRSYARVRDNLEELCRRVDVNRPTQMLPNYGAMSVDELVVSHGATPRIRALADAWTHALFGLPSGDVAALSFLLHCKCAGGLAQAVPGAGGVRGTWRLGDGAERLLDELAARLLPGTLWLSHEVEAIDQTSASECVVTTRAGAVVHCSKVVLAVSAPYWRNIALAPGLGQDKRWLAAKDATAGLVGAVHLLYDEPWWRERGFSGRGVGVAGPVCAVADTTRDGHDGHRLTCLVAVEPARELCQLPEGQSHARILRQVEAMFGGAPPAPRGVLEQPPAAGHLVVPARNLADLERDQWRPEGNILFAGADTSLTWRGHMEGALAASARASDEVLRSMWPLPELASRL